MEANRMSRQDVLNPKSPCALSTQRAALDHHPRYSADLQCDQETLYPQIHEEALRSS